MRLYLILVLYLKTNYRSIKMENRIYLVLYNAYKLGDLECGGSRPLFISHDKNETIKFFKKKVQECKDLFVDFETEEDTETSFIFNNGKWQYEYSLNSIPLDTDLTLEREYKFL